MRAISMPRMSRTVIEATTSPRASFSFTWLRRTSLILADIGPSGSYLRGNRRYAVNYSTDFKSIRDDVSAQEWQARIDLAACYRLVDQYGMADLIYNHITARIPGTEHLLINLYGLLYKEITASSLVKIDVEGKIIAKPDTDYGINVSGYVIHGAIHKARPDVAACCTPTRGPAWGGRRWRAGCCRCRRPRSASSAISATTTTRVRP